MPPPPGRTLRVYAASLTLLALVTGALAVPAIARWGVAARVRHLAASRGLSASWRSLEWRFPADIAISRLTMVDPARADTAFRCESLSLAIDPLSIVLLHLRPRSIELDHARARIARGRGADPDTLAPEDESPARGRHRPPAEKVRRAAESLVGALLLPARRLPRIELRDVAIVSGSGDDEPGAAAVIEWFGVTPSREGVSLHGQGRIVLDQDVPFAFDLRYGNDDRVQGGARFGIWDAATGRDEPLRVTVDGRLEQDRRAGAVRIVAPTRVNLGQVPIRILGAFEQRGPRFEIHLECDSLTEQRILASLPRPLLGPLADVSVSGWWDYRVSLRLDVSQPDSVDFHADVVPHGLAIDPGRTRLNLLTLDQPFTATIHLPHDRSVTREMSEHNPLFRPLEAIDSLLVYAVVTNEDGGFFHHHGFNSEAVKGSIADNIRAGAYRRGAGTITMQLVRNLYLGHNRTLSRKAQEVALAWMLEHLTYVTKRRLLEIYLNIIEWGPGVHGIGEAARYYFGTDPAHLAVDEVLFLTTVIPSPSKWRYRLDATGALRPFERAQMHFIGRAMVKKGWLAAEDLPPAEALRVEITGPARELLFPGEAPVAADTTSI